MSGFGLLHSSLGNFPILARWRWDLRSYIWTRRVGLAGLGFLVLWVAFVAVVRIVNLPLGGIQPEAFALIAMMTALFTVGGVLLATLAAWGLEKMVRRRLARG